MQSQKLTLTIQKAAKYFSFFWKRLMQIEMKGRYGRPVHIACAIGIQYYNYLSQISNHLKL